MDQSFQNQQNWQHGQATQPNHYWGPQANGYQQDMYGQVPYGQQPPHDQQPLQGHRQHPQGYMQHTQVSRHHGQGRHHQVPPQESEDEEDEEEEEPQMAKDMKAWLKQQGATDSTLATLVTQGFTSMNVFQFLTKEVLEDMKVKPIAQKLLLLSLLSKPMPKNNRAGKTFLPMQHQELTFTVTLSR